MFCLNNFLGLSLIQNNNSLIKYFINTFSKYFVDEETGNMIKGEPEVENELYILISIAEKRLDGKINHV